MMQRSSALLLLLTLWVITSTGFVVPLGARPVASARSRAVDKARDGARVGPVCLSIPSVPLPPLPLWPSSNEHKPGGVRPFSLAKSVLLGPFAFEAYTDPSRQEGHWQLDDIQPDNEVAILNEHFLHEAYTAELAVGVKRVVVQEGERGRRHGWFPNLPLMGPGEGIGPELHVAVELGNADLGKAHLHVNTSAAVSNATRAFSSRPIDHSSLKPYHFKSPFIPPKGKRRVNLTVAGADGSVLGAAVVDLEPMLKEVMTDHSKGQGSRASKRGGTWKYDVPLSRKLDGSAGQSVNMTVELEVTFKRFNPPPASVSARHWTLDDWVGAKGCSRDWRPLAEQLGSHATTAGDMELLCFVENKETRAQVKLWRDVRRKRLLVAFRGTEFWNIRHLVTDLKLLQEPWEVNKLDSRRSISESHLHQSTTAESVKSKTATSAAAGGASSSPAAPNTSSDVPFWEYMAQQAMMYNVWDRVLKDVPSLVTSYLRSAWPSQTPSFDTHVDAVIEASSKRTADPLVAAASPLRRSGGDQSRLSSTPTAPSPAAGKVVRDEHHQHPAHVLGGVPWPGFISLPADFVASPAAAEKAVADIFKSALDAALSQLSPASQLIVSGQMWSFDEFRGAFDEVISRSGWALGHSVLAAWHEATSTLRSLNLPEHAVNITTSVPDLRPLVLLPERFRAIFDSLVNESLRNLAAACPTPALPASTSSSALPSAAAPSTEKEGPGAHQVVQQHEHGSLRLLMLPAGFFTDSQHHAEGHKVKVVNMGDVDGATGSGESAPKGIDFRALLSQSLDATLHALHLTQQAAHQDEQQRQMEHHGQHQQHHRPPRQQKGGFHPDNHPRQKTHPQNKDNTQHDQQPHSKHKLHGKAEERMELPPLDVESFGRTEEPRVHSGFKEAYLSVRDTLMDLLGRASGGRLKEDGWEVMVTGHSMGGALATLMAHDLAVNRLPGNRVTMYSFGQPRVGNRAFVREFAEAGVEAYRIVNAWDVIARFPRSQNVSSFLDYDHAGRTVLLDTPTGKGVWVEGEHPGECPLRDLRPYRPSPPPSHVQYTDAGTSSAQSSSGGSLLGNLEPLFLEAEWQLLQALVTGAALSSHLEAQYHQALTNITLASAQPVGVSGGRVGVADKEPLPQHQHQQHTIVSMADVGRSPKLLQSSASKVKPKEVVGAASGKDGQQQTVPTVTIPWTTALTNWNLL